MIVINNFKMSESGIKFLSNLEGIRFSVYDDATGKVTRFGAKVIGNCTIGIGHLILPGELFPYSPQALTYKQIIDLFRKDLIRYEYAVNKNVKVNINQNQFDALVSFTFNIGIGGFLRSSTLRFLNQKNYQRAAEAILLWKNPGLLLRRFKERKLFLS